MDGGFRRWVIGLAAAAGLAGTSPAPAANETAPMMQYLGYTSLWQSYGGGLANGNNVSVSIVESRPSQSAVYYPAVGDGRFAGKTMTATATATLNAGSSSHATNVGARFFGNDTGFSQRSVAPLLGNAATGQSVQMYSYSEWNGLYFLSPGSGVPYGSQNNSRVSSHAYGYTDTQLDDIARLDYTVARDDYLHVVDARQFSTQGNAMNAIVTAPAGGASTLTTLPTAGGVAVTGTPYTAGRASPHITGPISGAGSDSIGQVAGVVGLLVSRGKTTASNHSYLTAATTAVQAPYSGLDFTTYSKPGYTVNSGDTSEVVRAALMAGALRQVADYSNVIFVPGISDYRATADTQAANGLDTRYGAGMVNARNSYLIVSAGEFNSAQDGLSLTGQAAAGGIGQYGFDYDPSFGGAGGSNRTAAYGFTASADGKFSSTLSWNLQINNGQTTGNFNANALTLYDLNLSLVDLTDNNVQAVTSASADYTTENLYTDLVAGHSYMLIVTATGADFDWDYGLAWRAESALTPIAVPEPAMVALSVLGGAGLLMRRRKAQRHD